MACHVKCTLVLESNMRAAGTSSRRAHVRANLLAVLGNEETDRTGFLIFLLPFQFIVFLAVDLQMENKEGNQDG